MALKITRADGVGLVAFPAFQLGGDDAPMNLFPYQQTLLDQTWDREGWGFFLDPGLGKTRCAIATAYRLYTASHIDAAVIIAPNMIHRSWLADELPKCSGESMPQRTLVYDAGTSRNVAPTQDRARFLSPTHNPVLRWLALSYDALLTESGYKFSEAFLKANRCLLIFDESSRIKNPRASRTKVCLKLSRLAPFTRILSGTPLHNSPLDLYSQMQALHSGFWIKHGFASFTAFRAYFAILHRRMIQRAGRMIQFDEIKGYRNLERLALIVATASTRIHKADVLSLPPMTLTSRSFVLGNDQKKHYEELRANFLTFIGSNLITTQHALTMMIRLQQIASGFVTSEDGSTVLELKQNTRLDFLKELLEDRTEQAIIFCKFDYSVDHVTNTLNRTTAGLIAAALDGRTPDHARNHILKAFQEGGLQYLVTKQRVGGVGLNLQNAHQIYHYEGEWSYGDRIQSNDRIHRIGQTEDCNITSLIAANTVDETIQGALTLKDSWSKLTFVQQLKEVLNGGPIV